MNMVINLQLKAYYKKDVITKCEYAHQKFFQN